jgi:[acyl-carrier-protein] S-malonyltransferase
VVKVRAESMAAAAKQGRAHGMLSVVGLADEDISSLCDEARVQAGGPDTVCQLANMLFPQVGDLPGWLVGWLGLGGLSGWLIP